MKRILTFAIIALLLFGFVSCSSSVEEKENPVDSVTFSLEDSLYTFNRDGSLIVEEIGHPEYTVVESIEYTSTQEVGLNAILSKSASSYFFKSESKTDYIADFDELVTLNAIYSFSSNGDKFFKWEKI